MEETSLSNERDSSPLSEHANDEEAGSNRRKSARSRRKPELYSSQTYASSSTKRKRTDSRAEGDENDASDAEDIEEGVEDEVIDEEDQDNEDEDTSEDEPAEEELRERRRAAKKAAKPQGKQSAAAKTKRAPKKPKIGNGIATELTLRPAVNGQRKTSAKSKKVRARPTGLDENEEGLYAEIFARGHTTDAVAAEWLSTYEKDAVDAMREIINFVLRCTGTDLKVNTHDIEDVDNAANRLNDLQEEYQAQNITDYPLISKSKKYRSFQAVLTGFFDSIVRTIHSSSILYTDPALIENIQAWITSMSSAPIRPFRHTATIIALTIVTSVCQLAREVSSTVSLTRKQLETEKKKKTVNSGRVGALQTKIQEFEQKLETIDGILHDSFDTVFVHRYRDVDPKIRAECMTSLGGWITTYREVFFEGQYLRYLGWVLSDTVAQTRAVVIQQLRRLFQNKDNIAGLRGFTERFRPRIVEMAVRDAESSVRASAVELLDLIRNAGLLEPDDIDSVGRLVFDTEPRVRKAAGRFFVANIQDVFDATIEGQEEEVNDAFGDEEDTDEFTTPKRSWIKYKCLVDILQVYDSQQSELEGDPEVLSKTSLFNGQSESRFVLATETVYPHLKELDQWESLAGYLLYDHSQISDSSGDSDPANSVKELYKLNEGQEAILLEVLGCAVKLHIQVVSKSDVDKKGRRTKQSVQNMEAKQESIAHNLSQIIPQLLNKFGAVPEAASAVLKLEHLVNLELIQDLQKDAAAYSELINNINKQFLTHSDRSVLAEATVAFLHARTSEELREAMENKVQELWDDTVDTLRSLSTNKNVHESRTLSTSVLTELCHTVMRISNIASISDCTSTLETTPPNVSKKQKSTPEPAVDILLNMLQRGLREPDSDDEVDTLERDLIIHTLKTLLVYFMWKVQSMRAGLLSRKASYNGNFFDSLTQRRETFVSSLTAIMQQRTGVDDVRIAAASTLMELQIAFGTLRQATTRDNNSADDDFTYRIGELVQEIPQPTSNVISRIHDALLKAYARKSHHRLEEPAEDEPPIDSQSDIEPNSDEEDEEMGEDETDVQFSARRMRATLLAEQRLCEFTGKIVLAIIGRVLDASGSQAGKLKQRLLRNKSRLGQNYKAVLAYFDDNKPTAAATKRPGASKGGKERQPNGNGNFKSAERIEDDHEDIEHEDPIEDDEEEGLRARGLVEDEDRIREDVEGAESPLTPVDDDIMGD